MKIRPPKDLLEKRAVIKVFGVGGGGSNAVSHMFDKKLHGVEIIALNTDVQALAVARAAVRIQLGEKLSKGLGVGGKPELGRMAAEETRRRLEHTIAGTDLLFIVAGMGGGTGTGGAPVIASVARSMGVLTIGIVTKPFKFEGSFRQKQAEDGIREMRDFCDTAIIVPNEKILSLYKRETGVAESFKQADEVLYQAVKSVSDIITRLGVINRDMADLKSVLKSSKEAYIGMGESRGTPDRAREAALRAINNPLLEEVSLNGAGKLLVTIFGGDDVTIGEITEAMELIRARCNSDAHIFFGQVLDPGMHGIFKIAVIAADFAKQAVKMESEKKFKQEDYWKRPAFEIWKPRKLT